VEIKEKEKEKENKNNNNNNNKKRSKNNKSPKLCLGDLINNSESHYGFPEPFVNLIISLIHNIYLNKIGKFQ
jgi:hypothetical protein